MHGAAGGVSGDRGVGVELAPRALHSLTYNASYLANMVKSWANSATRRFAEEGKSKFAGPDVEKAEDLLAALNAAAALSDLKPVEVGRPAQADRRPQGSVGDDGPGASAFAPRTVMHGTSGSSTIMRGHGTMKAIHPGRILRRELESRKMSANALALALRTPSGRIVDILQARNLARNGAAARPLLRRQRNVLAPPPNGLRIGGGGGNARRAHRGGGEAVGGVTTPSTDEARAA